MAAHVTRSFAFLLLGFALAAAGCSAPPPPFAQLSGLVLAPQLDELSGLAASRAHPDTLWAINDGGNAPALYAIGNHGGLQATFRIAGVINTDWEDLAAFDLDGRHYLLIADTGDNGGLRRTLQLHVVEEPKSLEDGMHHDGVLQPAWSIVFRWPDGARDCEAVAVDAVSGQILLISKRRRPPELFALPLRPDAGLQTARLVGHLSGIPEPDAQSLRQDARHARIGNQITAVDISPDGQAIAVLTYHDVLLYRRPGQESWAQALASKPQVHELPWLPQAEGLAWSADGSGLYATGEHSPAPLLYLNP